MKKIILLLHHQVQKLPLTIFQESIQIYIEKKYLLSTGGSGSTFRLYVSSVVPAPGDLLLSTQVPAQCDVLNVAEWVTDQQMFTSCGFQGNVVSIEFLAPMVALPLCDVTFFGHRVYGIFTSL